jgi:hypothetical protein
VNRIPLAVPSDPYQVAALDAIDEAIDHNRELLGRLAARNNPLAEHVALRVRKLENAAWELGENIDRYLPAVYRDPREARR